MKYSKRKLLNLSLICALISAMMLSMVGFSYSCNEMYDNIIRIRIIPNSDSKEDQALKIAIRDAVLGKTSELFTDTKSYDDAVAVTKSNTDKMLTAAKNVVRSEGLEYDVTLEIREEFFDTRVYEEFTLPAGYYETAVFTVGEGKGSNWWCVIYPQVCVGSCSATLNESLSDDTAEVAYNSEKYVVKFKTIEILEKIKKCFNLSK